MKRCAKCKKYKELEEFPKCSKGKDGYFPRCKDCKRENDRIYREKCSEQIKKRHFNWRKKNPDKIKAAAKRTYIKTNKQAESYKKLHREANTKWKRENPGKWNAIAAKYRAAKINATPPWLTVEHLEEIKELYMLAQELAWVNNGEALEVDHVIPLQGKDVCGLHVPWNLQILPKSFNSKKNNRI